MLVEIVIGNQVELVSVYTEIVYGKSTEHGQIKVTNHATVKRRREMKKKKLGIYALI
jgi:hypothetical protein